MNATNVPLFSFQSISKGYYGECGLRGGYTQCENVDEQVIDQMYKLMSMNLCSNTLAQAMIASILTPPLKGEPSYELFAQESEAILTGMKKKAVILENGLNKIDGMGCLPIEGAMYGFPQVHFPQQFIDHCTFRLKKPPGTVYALGLLKKLGLVVVPGNGFGQHANTYHFRITILPPEEDLVRILDELKVYHEAWLEEWGGLDRSDNGMVTYEDHRPGQGATPVKKSPLKSQGQVSPAGGKKAASSDAPASAPLETVDGCFAGLVSAICGVKMVKA